MPTPPVAIGELARDVYQQLLPVARDDAAQGWPLAHYVAALIGPLEEVNSWVRDTDAGPGYSVLMDLDRCPAKALPWLAQFKGVVIPDGLTETQQRQWIKDAEGQRRGTTDSLVKAGQRHLTGTKSVQVIERNGGPYNITVITRTSETPTPSVTLADFMSAKRIGIVLTHVVSSAPIYDAATRTYDGVTSATYDAATVADVT